MSEVSSAHESWSNQFIMNYYDSTRIKQSKEKQENELRDKKMPSATRQKKTTFTHSIRKTCQKYSNNLMKNGHLEMIGE